MTDDQLTALAREYAEQTDGSPEDMAYRKAIAENAFRFLSRRYSLVEKRYVKEAHKFVRSIIIDGYKSKSSCMIEVGKAYKALLEYLFPEIGKEVEG